MLNIFNWCSSTKINCRHQPIIMAVEIPSAGASCWAASVFCQTGEGCGESGHCRLPSPPVCFGSHSPSSAERSQNRPLSMPVVMLSSYLYRWKVTWEETIDRSAKHLVRECELTAEEIVKKNCRCRYCWFGWCLFSHPKWNCVLLLVQGECNHNAVERNRYLTAELLMLNMSRTG